MSLCIAKLISGEFVVGEGTADGDINECLQIVFGPGSQINLMPVMLPFSDAPVKVNREQVLIRMEADSNMRAFYQNKLLSGNLVLKEGLSLVRGSSRES